MSLHTVGIVVLGFVTGRLFSLEPSSAFLSLVGVLLVLYGNYQDQEEAIEDFVAECHRIEEEEAKKDKRS